MNPKSFLTSSCHHLLVKSYYFLFFSHLTQIAFSSVDSKFESCQPQSCGNGPNISFPFYIKDRQHDFCGYPRFDVFCGDKNYPILNLSNNHYIIHEIFYNNDSLRVSDPAFSPSNSRTCFPRVNNLRLYGDRFDLAPKQTDLFLLFGCDSKTLPTRLNNLTIGCSKANNSTATGSVLCFHGNGSDLMNAIGSNRCQDEVVKATVEDTKEGVLGALGRGFWLKWRATNCSRCQESGEKCGFDREIYDFRCYCPDRPHSWQCGSEGRSLALKLGLGLGLGLGFPAIVIGLLIGLVYKRKYASSKVQFHSRDTYSDPYSDESSSAYGGIPVFPYKELEEATNHFDRTRELGDGGFGTVYYGKLQDGREVAVKRLYEHNYRRVQQFMNEVKILTHLRHKNLVSLYGCTSRQSRELLLVYEYIPNGTVACHLHGDLAKPGLMPWHVRMKIAIETASALVYLHASDIVHRDVKTNNILLDNSFCVKVADFGLSRVFPNDVTHVSTAPQGTPGYVDPEYYHCYQVTSKSDVYSFGVVLIELISSMPAVDMSRHNDEINLSDLAVKKIRKSAFSELVDPSLGFVSDNDVKRMIILVAELAFQCLQQEKELRPSMDEVLEALKSIESVEAEPEHLDEADVQDAGALHSNIHPVPPSSPEWDEVGLLKNMKPPRSPNTVTHNWESKSTTPNVSG